MILEGSLWNYTLSTLAGEPFPLKQFENKVKAILLVNTASRCGFTGQLKDLQTLYESYRNQGLLVIGVPSNDFLGQEPLTNDAIADFCSLNYGVNFPLTSKTHVAKKEVDPLFQWLSQYSKPKWNFHKYLFDREGHLVEAYLSVTAPMSKTLTEKIEQLLK